MLILWQEGWNFTRDIRVAQKTIEILASLRFLPEASFYYHGIYTKASRKTALNCLSMSSGMGCILTSPKRLFLILHIICVLKAIPQMEH